jgi:Zn-dependent protease
MPFLYDVAAAFAHFTDGAPPLALLVVLCPIAGMAVVLLHELGHALVAHRLLGTPVRVTVGRHARFAGLQLGKVEHERNAVGRLSGTTQLEDSAARARDVVWIALAGPAASLAGTVLTATVLAAAQPDGIVHAAAWTATSAGIVALLFNLIPAQSAEPSGALLRSDGRLALDALRITREMAVPARPSGCRQGP